MPASAAIRGLAQGSNHGGKQRIGTDGFFENGSDDVAVSGSKQRRIVRSGNNYDMRPAANFLHRVQDFNAVRTWHFQIQQNAISLWRKAAVKKLLARYVFRNAITRMLQHHPKGSTDAVVIIDNGYNMVVWVQVRLRSYRDASAVNSELAGILDLHMYTFINCISSGETT